MFKMFETLYFYKVFIKFVNTLEAQYSNNMATDIRHSFPTPTAHILTTLIILCTVIAIIILSHLFANLFGCCSLKQRGKNGKQTGCLIVFSIASIISLFTQSLIQLGQFNDTVSFTTVHCQIYYGTYLAAYAISKHSMHAFFVHRMGETFQNSSLAIPKWKLHALYLLSFILICISTTIIVLICMDVEAEDTTFGGTYCALQTVRTTYLAIFMTIVMVSDVSLSFIINFVMINKLLTLVSLKLQANVNTSLWNAIAS